MKLLRTPKHRADVAVRRAAHRHSFKPRHCAGETCFHDHHGEPARARDFAPLNDDLADAAS